MILSTMGNASSSSFTIENSCSGPRTSRVLYVKARLLLKLFSTIEYKATIKQIVQVRRITREKARAKITPGNYAQKVGKPFAKEKNMETGALKN